MTNLDFLPNDYRRRAANRSTHAWLFILLLVFGAFVGVVSSYQLLTLRTLRQQSAEVELPYSQAELAKKRFAELESQLADTNVHADLHTFLRHPWPRTQVLAALVKHLPPEVDLTEVTIRREQLEVEKDLINPQQIVAAQQDKEASKKLDVQQSLKLLREETEATRTVVRVRGVTTDNSALHHCIRAIGQSRLFTKANLESLDSTDDDATTGTASFEMCVELLPGYGRTGGPTEGPSENIES